MANIETGETKGFDVPRGSKVIVENRSPLASKVTVETDRNTIVSTVLAPGQIVEVTRGDESFRVRLENADDFPGPGLSDASVQGG